MICLDTEIDFVGNTYKPFSVDTTSIPSPLNFSKTITDYLYSANIRFCLSLRDMPNPRFYTR